MCWNHICLFTSEKYTHLVDDCFHWNLLWLNFCAKINKFLSLICTIYILYKRINCVSWSRRPIRRRSPFPLACLSPQISLENDYLGPRRIDALKKEDQDWQKKAQEAVLNIQEFTVKYFEITARAQKGRVRWRRLSKGGTSTVWVLACDWPLWGSERRGWCDLVFRKQWTQRCPRRQQEQTRTTYWLTSASSTLPLCRVCAPCAPLVTVISSV